MRRRRSQRHKVDSNLRTVASVIHRRLRDAGYFEAKVDIVAPFLHSASRKRIFLENESKDGLQRGFLGQWNRFRNITYEQFLMAAFEKRSRFNENECNSRSGLDQMTNEICFETWLTNSF